MSNRDLLLAGIDLLFALLIVFVIGFFSVRYDENRGSNGEVLRIETLKATMNGDYQSLHFLALFLGRNTLEAREYAFGQWATATTKWTWDWRESLKHMLAENDLPIVIYETDESDRLGDVVRQVSRTGQPVGVATLPPPSAE